VIVAGIDVGSANTKIVIYDRENEVIRATAIARTGMKPRATAEAMFQNALQRAELQSHEISRAVATGYARYSVNFASDYVTEITATAKGIKYWHPTARTIIDIGGQDSKVITLNSNGVIQEFVMNDRCAAGTGSFLEFIARGLDIPLEDFGTLSRYSQNPVQLSSLCVVMVETEILSMVAAEVPREDIIAGLHQALATRVANLARRLPIEPDVIFTGGTALNSGMRHALEQTLGLPVITSQHPLHTAALGAALLA